LTLHDGRVFGLFNAIFAKAEESAQLRTNDEEGAGQHGASHLKEQEPGAWIGISIRRALKGNGQCGYLRDGKQNEHNTGETTQSMPPKNQ
jgi:hypothetical protein